jgi:hypothetical protein
MSFNKVDATICILGWPNISDPDCSDAGISDGSG